MTDNKAKSNVWTPLFFSLVLTAGMILGFNLRDTLRNKRDFATVIRRNDRLEEIIDLINEKYVDSVNGNALYRDAISGIIRSLDPHTVFIPAEDLQNDNDDLDGEFSGIGVEFAMLDDTLRVTYVLDNSPASRAGVHTGDQFVKVGDSTIAGVHITTDRIMHLLKGHKETVVNVLALRGDSKTGIPFAITRNIIPINSVEASIMLNPTTGFIKINRFSATTAHEFVEALQKLMSAGAKQLILDLRDNPGGYLDAATSIADAFLDSDKLVVYTKGLHAKMTEYRANTAGFFKDGKLAILVNEGSASASEILSGAIQDHDRGIIVGRRTFGKGLVQEQYELPDGSALRLTIARYYTPSGRCIQRSFAKGREAYMQDFEKRFETEEVLGTDTTHNTDTTKYYTADRRVVYGGGGITPDVLVAYDTSKAAGNVNRVVNSEAFKIALWRFYLRNKDALVYKNPDEFRSSFNGEANIIGNYLAAANDSLHSVIQSLFKGPQASELLKLQAKAQLARILFRDEGYYSVSAPEDKTVKSALESLSTNKYRSIVGGH